jgi:hypothetical protein
MNGLLRYNAIQKALSSVKVEKGWKLEVGSFQRIASKVYHETKSQPLKHVISNIDVIVDAIPEKDTPLLPPEFHEWMPFFNFDAEAKSGNGVWSPDLVSDNIIINAPQLFGDEYAIDASLLSYEDHFKRFTDYCNANRDIWWHDSTDAPVWRFTEPAYDWNTQKWLITLELGRDDGYGYDPAEPVGENELVARITKEEIEDLTKPAAPPPEAEKPSEKELEIRKIEAETEKIKASERKLSELNKAVDRLDSQLERKLITVAEYKKYLKKLYDL